MLRRLPPARCIGAVRDVGSTQWFADGTRILLCGVESGHAARCYVHDLSAAAPRAVTPEGTADAFPSPDGKQVLARDAEGSWVEVPLAGGQPRRISSLAPKDVVLRWPDMNLVLVRGPLSDVPARVERVDLVTGTRMQVAQFAPADLTGTVATVGGAITADAKWYAYSVMKQTSTLFLMEPVK